MWEWYHTIGEWKKCLGGGSGKVMWALYFEGMNTFRGKDKCWEEMLTADFLGERKVA